MSQETVSYPLGRNIVIILYSYPLPCDENKCLYKTLGGNLPQTQYLQKIGETFSYNPADVVQESNPFPICLTTDRKSVHHLHTPQYLPKYTHYTKQTAEIVTRCGIFCPLACQVGQGFFFFFACKVGLFFFLPVKRVRFLVVRG